MLAASTTICESQLTDGTRYFFLSMVGISVLSAFSQITYPNESAHFEDYDSKRTYWDAVRVLLADPLSFSLSLLYDGVATIQVSSIQAEAACDTHRRGVRP